MLKYLTLTFFALILFTSCDEEVKQPFAIEIICEAPLSEDGKYPSFFQNVLMPIPVEHGFFVPKPIKIRRIDTGGGSIEINAFEFEKNGEPTLEFYQTWLPDFFAKNAPPKELLVPKGNLETTTDWVLKTAAKQPVIVTANDPIEAFDGNENIFFCADEAAVSKKIAELLAANPETKISLAIVSAPPPTPVAKLVNKPKEDYGKTSEGIDMNESFHEIWEKAEAYIGTPFNEIDHDNEHPELFSIMVKAGLAAIKQGKADDMVEHLDEIKKDKTAFFRKVYPGHEKRWNTIYHLAEEKDTIALNKILAKLQSEVKDAKSKMVDEF